MYVIFKKSIHPEYLLLKNKSVYTCVWTVKEKVHLVQKSILSYLCMYFLKKNPFIPLYVLLKNKSVNTCIVYMHGLFVNKFVHTVYVYYWKKICSYTHMYVLLKKSDHTRVCTVERKNCVGNWTNEVWIYVFLINDLYCTLIFSV